MVVSAFKGEVAKIVPGGGKKSASCRGCGVRLVWGKHADCVSASTPLTGRGPPGVNKYGHQTLAVNPSLANAAYSIHYQLGPFTKSLNSPAVSWHVPLFMTHAENQDLRIPARTPLRWQP